MKIHLRKAIQVEQTKLSKTVTVVYLAVSTPEISDRLSDIQEITVQTAQLLTFQT